MDLTTYAESISCPNKKELLQNIKRESNIFFNALRINTLKLRKYSQG